MGPTSNKIILDIFKNIKQELVKIKKFVLLLQSGKIMKNELKDHI